MDENNEVMEYDAEVVETEEENNNSNAAGWAALGVVGLIGGLVGYGIKTIKDKRAAKKAEQAQEDKPTLKQKIAYALLKDKTAGNQDPAKKDESGEEESEEK